MALDLGVATDDDELISEVAGAVAEQRCVLFMGAAVHAPPPKDSLFAYSEEERPSSARRLSRALADACNLSVRRPEEDVENLQRVALFYEIKHRRDKLVDEVISAVQTDKRPSPMVKALAELGFPVVVTTNYDQLFETAFVQAAGTQPRKIIYTPNLEPTATHRNPTAASPIVVKIHGDVERRETLVITDEDYIRFVLRMTSQGPYEPIPVWLKSRFLEWTTLFVGYSLLDYNLRLLFHALNWGVDPASLPEMYSVDYCPDPLVLHVFHDQRQYLKFIVQDVWKFVPELYRQVTGKELQP